MTLPTPTAQPTAPSAAPRPLDLSYAQAMQAAQVATPPAQTAVLPSSVQSPLTQLWSHLQVAQDAFNGLGEQHTSIWENSAYPVEHRRVLVSQLLTQTFATVDSELTTAEGNLKAAQDALKTGLTPPLLGAPDVHELKLMNAREEVRTALEGLQPFDQARTLKELFEESLADDLRSPIAFFIAGTDAYKRLLKDAATRAAFGVTRLELLKKLLPPTAAPFFTADEAIKQASDALQMAKTARYFIAKDNGLPTPTKPQNLTVKQPSLTL